MKPVFLWAHTVVHVLFQTHFGVRRLSATIFPDFNDVPNDKTSLFQITRNLFFPPGSWHAHGQKSGELGEGRPDFGGRRPRGEALG